MRTSHHGPTLGVPAFRYPSREAPPFLCLLLLLANCGASLQAQELRGDPNRDGRLDIADAVMVLRVVVGAVPQADVMPEADVAPVGPDGTRGDGRVDVGDAVALLQALLGLAPEHAAPLRALHILYPPPGSVTGDSLRVQALAASTRGIRELRVRAGGEQAVLTPQEANGRLWQATVYLASQPTGELLLVVTATEEDGATFEASTNLLLRDLAPTLTVDAPLAETVARPGVRVTAGCGDDSPEGCASLTVEVLGSAAGPPEEWQTLLSVPGGALNEDAWLADFEGRRVMLRVTGRDSRGQTDARTIPVIVESSPSLLEAQSVTGVIQDVDPERILFTQTSDSVARLMVRSRPTGEDSVLLTAEPAGAPLYGFLAPGGAIYVAPRLPWTGLHYDVSSVRDGEVTPLGPISSPASLRVAGGYALWNNGGELVLRDLQAGTNTVVPGTTGNTVGSVASNGDVVYVSEVNRQVYRFRAGETILASIGSGAAKEDPITDGQVIVYRIRQESPDGPTYRIAAMLPEGEVLLSPPQATAPQPGLDYQVRGGWVAFTRPGPLGDPVVWLRSPAGEERQITPSGVSNVIEHLGGDGELTVYQGTRVHLTGFDRTAVDVGSNIGRFRELNGTWYAVYGRTLFRVEPVSNP